MGKRVSGLLSLAVVLVLAVPAAAGAAATLGTTTQPTGSSPNGCGAWVGDRSVHERSEHPVHGAVGGRVDRTLEHQYGGRHSRPAGHPRGAAAERPATALRWSAPIPRRSRIRFRRATSPTYTLSAPISVAEGDTLGLWTDTDSGVTCYWDGGSTPATDTLNGFNSPTLPTTGQVFASFGTSSPPGFTMNVSATLEPGCPGRRCDYHRGSGRRGCRLSRAAVIDGQQRWSGRQPDHVHRSRAIRIHSQLSRDRVWNML